MVLLEPRDNIITEFGGQCAHRLRVGVRYKADALVAGDVTLLSEGVERVDDLDIDAERFAQ